MTPADIAARAVAYLVVGFALVPVYVWVNQRIQLADARRKGYRYTSRFDIHRSEAGAIVLLWPVMAIAGLAIGGVLSLALAFGWIAERIRLTETN